jgi:hypothetical protein
MSDLESLVLVVAAIYLFECAVWIGRSGVAFDRSWGKDWRFRHPGTILGNPHGALFLANPLPPLGSVFLSYPWPITLSPHGIVSLTASAINPGGQPPQTLRYVTYEEARQITAQGKKVFINDSLFVKASSAPVARNLAAWLRELRALPENKRSSAIKQKAMDSLDTESVRKRWNDFQASGQRLRGLGNLLFWSLFAAAPLLLWRFGFKQAGLAVAGGLLVQTCTLGWHFWRTYGALFPGQTDERFVPFLTMLLAPPTAIRAHDLLGRHLLESFHPLAVAQVLCRPAEFERLATRALLDLHYPLQLEAWKAAPRVAAALDWFRQVLQQGSEKLLHRAGLEPSKLLQPPARTERANQTFCPRCRAQFIVAQGTCEECGGRSLQPLPDRIQLPH